MRTMLRAIAIAFLCGAVASAQVTGTVQNFGAASGAVALQSLGFNITAGPAGVSQTEFQMAQQIGSTGARFDINWGYVEIQNTNNTSGGFQEPSWVSTALSYAKTYGQRAFPNADYGPTYQLAAIVTVTANTSTGATSIPVSFTSAGVNPGITNLATLSSNCADGQSLPLCGEQVVGGQKTSPKWDYSGTLVTAISSGGGTITLASATNIALTSGTQLWIYQNLYTPAGAPAGTSTWLTNPSTLKYLAFARYLQSLVIASGAGGATELWNEPPWLGGFWINAANEYDTGLLPGSLSPASVLGIENVYVLTAQGPSAGYNYISNWLNKGSQGSVFDNNYTSITSLSNLLNGTIQSEAMHPYTHTPYSWPEAYAWLPSCIAYAVSIQSVSYASTNCSPAGNAAPNVFLGAGYYNQLNGIAPSITEVGLFDSGDATPIADARYDMRQWLTAVADGVSPIIEFRMCCNSGFDWLSPTYQPYQNYIAFQQLMSDIATYTPVLARPASETVLPIVTSYTATQYPLDTQGIVGGPAGAVSNSILFYAWQQSNSSTLFNTLASPTPAPITVTIPLLMSVVKVVDTVTLNPVAFTQTGTSVTYNVADDPVEMVLTSSVVRPPPAIRGSLIREFAIRLVEDLL